MAIVSSAELRDIRGKAEKGSVNNAAIITRAELDRIKAETVIKSVEQIRREHLGCVKLQCVKTFVTTKNIKSILANALRYPGTGGHATPTGSHALLSYLITKF